jgi:PTS system ascorbate-specific IIA component
MIGILIITHGATGADLLATAAHVIGVAPPLAAALGVSRDDDPEAVLARARELLAQVDDGSGVLVLTDMFGATPCNVAGRLLADGHVEGVAGVSLPMLVRALSGREGTLGASVQRALSGGTEGVLYMNRDRCRDAQR